MSLEATERRCAEGRTAPRVKLSDIQAQIAEQHTFLASRAVLPIMEGPRHPLDVLTICLLVMKNGFTVIGKSAPASPDNFDPVLGAELAYEDAIRQLWPLMGFALRDRLSRDAA